MNYCIAHGTLPNVKCQSGWEGGGWIQCICMAVSLHCSPETITTLLIGYTPIQNVFDVKICFIKKNSETIWAWCFLFWKVINY